MREEILYFISELQKEREEAHIFPAHVLTVEIINRGFHNPYKALNKLYYEGKIEWHRTINDIAFTIKETKEKNL